MNHEEIIARLEASGRTLLSLPPAWLDSEAADCLPAIGAADIAKVRRRCGVPPRPSDDEIRDMQEAFGWIRMIDPALYVGKRMVSARALIHPVTGDHLFSWRRLAVLMGTDHKAVQRWHRSGIKAIEERLK